MYIMCSPPPLKYYVRSTSKSTNTMHCVKRLKQVHFMYFNA